MPTSTDPEAQADSAIQVGDAFPSTFTCVTAARQPQSVRGPERDGGLAGRHIWHDDEAVLVRGDRNR